MSGNLPVKRKIASRESKNRQNFRPVPSFSSFSAVARTATTGKLNAIFAKRPPGKFHHLKTATALARGVFIDVGFNGRTHALEKFSASAMALRIAMDLLTVS